ncbi:MAG: CsbD family protein [Sphingobium sp.]
MGEFIDKVKGKTNEAIGKAKQASDDPERRTDGKLQEAEGKVQQAVGSVKGAAGNRTDPRSTLSREGRPIRAAFMPCGVRGYRSLLT